MKKNYGWYYHSGNDKAPAWSGVEFLYQFLINNKEIGPFGKSSSFQEIETGDILQLSFTKGNFSHTLVVVEKMGVELDKILVATHTFDSYGRSVSSYSYQDIRAVHIQGVRCW